VRVQNRPPSLGDERATPLVLVDNALGILRDMILGCAFPFVDPCTHSLVTSSLRRSTLAL
jgi:hypothetical protein